MKSVRTGRIGMFWKTVLMTGIMSLVAMSFTITAFAADLGSVDSKVQQAAEKDYTISNGIVTFKGDNASYFNGGKVTSTRPSGDYYTLKLRDSSGTNVTYYMTKDNHAAAVSGVQGQNSVTETKDIINNQLGEDQFGIKADVGNAKVALSGFMGVAAMIIGIIAWAVIGGMSVFTALDICYIAFPVFRNKVEGSAESGSKAGSVMLKLVTDDAQYAVKQCNVENGKSPWGMYLKKRIIAYILLAIVIYILLTGKVDLIISIAMNFVSGIIDSLSHLAG